MNLFETTIDIQKGLNALNVFDINGAKKLLTQLSDFSVEALDILSGGETSWIIELNRLISNVQTMLGTVQTKIPLSIPFISMLQSVLLLLQFGLLKAELSLPKYDYFWAAVATYNEVSATLNGNWGMMDGFKTLNQFEIHLRTKAWQWIDEINSEIQNDWNV